jgi:hypothetical protein
MQANQNRPHAADASVRQFFATAIIFWMPRK